MHKIAILGKANSGKNTLAKILFEEINKKYENNVVYNYQVAFADPIKEIVKIMFPSIPRDYLFGPSHLRSEIISGAFKNGKPLTVRQALIDIGTSSREYNSEIWIQCLENKYEDIVAINNPYSVFIVPDLRFADEFELLKKKDFLFIKILREKSPFIDHISETGQNSILDSDFHFIIHNNGSLNDLKKETISFVNKLNLPL